MNDQRTLYCGNRHRRADGVPIGHSCRILAPEYLLAERLEEYGEAASLLERMPLVLHDGLADPRSGASPSPRTPFGANGGGASTARSAWPR